MTPQDFKLLKERLFYQLSKHKIKSVLDELSDLPFIREGKKNTCIIINARFEKLKTERIQGITQYDKLNTADNNILKNIIDFVNDLKSNDFIKTSLVVHTTLNDLKEKLEAIVELNGIEPVYDLLKAILKSDDLRKEVNEIEEQYSKEAWRLRRLGFDSIGDWDKVFEELKSRIKRVINKLKIEHLEDNWAITFSEIDLGITSSKVSILFALFSKIDDIKFPEKIEKEVTVTSVTKKEGKKIIEETETELVSDKEKRRFKRLMFLYQDAYQADDYESAYRYCMQVREEIEPESAHLYQALMLSYFKLLNKESDIIKQVIEGNGNKEQEFKNLLAYTQRLLSIIEKLSNAEKDSRKTTIERTAEYNTHEMISGLMVNLKNEYTKVKYDYIVSPKKDKKIKTEKRDKVKKCINIATEITKFLKTDVIFAEVVVNELAGGGKFKWLKINEKKELVNYDEDLNFDAYATFKNAQKLIKHYSRVDNDNAVQNAVQKILVRNLLKSLGEKYRKLSKKSKNKSDEYLSKGLAECIVAYRICTVLFKDEKTFCDIPIRELSSDDGILDWFELDYDAKLKGRFELSSVDNFDPMEMLEHFISIKYDKAAWQPHEAALKKSVYEKLQRKTRSHYDAITPFAELPTDEDIDAVVNLIDCIENWKKCYDLYKEKTFLVFAQNELIGAEKLQWFVINKFGLEPNPIFRKIKFPLKNRLQEFTQLINTRTSEENYSTIGQNLFEKIIRNRYRYLNLYLSRYPRHMESHREEIYDLMTATSRLYRYVQHLDIYKDTFFEEFICEHTAAWLIQKGEKISTNQQSKKFNPVKLLNIMINEIKKQHDETFRDEILKWIVDNRYKDDLKEYTNIRADYSPDTRKDIYSLLNKFKGYYELTDNPKYLEIPYQEYVSNKRVEKCWWRLFFLVGRLGEFMEGEALRTSYRGELKSLKKLHQATEKVSDKHKLKRPWLTPKKKPLQLKSGKNKNISGFALILNDLFGKKT